MKPDNHNQILIKALEEFKEREFAHVPKENEIDFTFSDEYIKKRDKITKNLSRSYWKFINTTAKRAAVIIISLIIAFSSLMTVDAFRESVIGFIYSVYETFTLVKPVGTQHIDAIDKFYSINKPEGFVKTEENHSDITFYICFSNDKEQDTILMQYTNSAHITFDSEHGEVNEEIINGTPCLTCENEVSYLCYWEFDGYTFELIYPKELGKDFMSDVVGKLIEVVPENTTE